MTSPTGAKSLKATWTPKRCEDNCWELIRSTMTRNTIFGLNGKLVQCLDKRSIMMLKSECKRNGPEAWKRLTAHFSSSKTPGVINLLEQLTSLSLKPTEEMTDYLIRAETLFSSLEVAGEKISEKLLVSVVLKCLPDSYEYFKTMHDFSNTPTPFSDLKRALKNFEDPQKLKDCGNSSNAKSEAELFVLRDNSEIFLVNVSAATGAGIWKVLVQLNSALFAKSLDTISLSVFRTQKWIKSLRIGRIFCRVVSFLSVVVLIVRKIKNWFWIPVLRDIYSVIKIVLLNFMMFLRKFVWMQITVFHLWKGKMLPKFLCLSSEVYLTCWI